MKIWRDWGRRPAKRVVPHPVLASGGEVQELVLHHSVTAEAPFLEVVRGIQSYHLDGDEGYFDIAYNYLVSSDGPDIAVGRGSAQGGATGSGVDSRTFSVCFVGDYSDKLLGAQEIENLKSLVSYLRGRGLLTSGFVVLNGHGNYRATSCPGRISEQLKQLEREVNAGAYRPPVIFPVPDEPEPEPEPEPSPVSVEVSDAIRAVSSALKSCASALSMLARSLEQ